MFATFAIGYLISLILTSSKSKDSIKEFTVRGLRKKLIAEKLTVEDGVSILPLALDKHALTVLSFFILQYVFLFIIAL